MNKLFKLTLLVGTLLLMQGCATHEKFVQKYNSWVGKNISHLIQQVGYPDSTYILPNRNKVYIYERSRIYSVPTMSMGYGFGGYGGGYGMFGYNSDVMQETCKLFLETNKKGTIIRWRSRGNRCVSY